MGEGGLVVSEPAMSEPAVDGGGLAVKEPAASEGAPAVQPAAATGCESDALARRKWQLVIFDHDGVVVDSEPLAARAMSEVLRGYGIDLNPEQVDRLFRGLSLPRTRALLEQDTGVAMPSSFERDYMQRSDEIKAEELVPIAGVIDVLDRLDAINMPYCMASSSQRATIASALRIVGLAGRFVGRWWGAEDVAYTKPAPDLFLLAAESMGVRPADCVVIEDTPIGVAAARAAGMAVLGYCASTGREALAAADVVFPRMDLLPGLLGL